MKEVINQGSRAASSSTEIIDIQIATAKKFPRDFERAKEEAIQMVTMDEETAESCIYSKPRGKDSKTGEQQFVKGESIRFAEIILSAWGNMHVATRNNGEDGRTVSAEGAAWDLEKNVRMTRETKRSIINKEGRKFSEDMIVTTENAASAIALRNAILGVIPKAFVKAVYREAVKFAIGEKLQEKVEKLFSRFNKNWKIEESRIYKYFDKSNVSDFSEEDVEEMMGIGTALKNGELKPENAFIYIEDSSASKAKSLESVLMDSVKPTTEKIAETVPASQKENMNKIFERNIKTEETK